MTPVERLFLASRLLAIDPSLGGMVLRSRAGASYQAASDHIANASTRPIVKLHPSLQSDALDGGVDVAASLSGNTLVRNKGLLAGSAKTLVLPMAERADPLVVSRLADQLDDASGHVLIAFDEGAEPDETCAAPLKDRLGFHIDLTDVGYQDFSQPCPAILHEDVPPKVTYSDDLPEVIIGTCVSLGIDSLRAGSFALKAACAHGRLLGKPVVDADDLEVALHLVLAPRATQVPAEDALDEAPPPTESESQSNAQDPSDLMIPQDILLDAVKAALPSDMLANLGTASARGAKGSGSGQKRIGNRRGRPLPARNTSAGSGMRIDLMATLRAAIPYQTLRRGLQPDRRGPIFYPSDLRHKRYQDHSDRLLIFAVDASGSAALARLAEAKGAVELLLAQAYARRDHVSLIAFRGSDAETLLPPTRSLVQTKRRLAELAGGGGTPLAAGLKHANISAEAAQRKGLTPTVILLTDGRANVALDGTPDRAQAAKDATAMGLGTLQIGADVIVIDTGNRPEPALRQLAQTIGGHYLSLPRANAQKLSESVQRRLTD